MIQYIGDHERLPDRIEKVNTDEKFWRVIEDSDISLNEYPFNRRGSEYLRDYQTDARD
jgi:hypothetical protein